MKRPSLQTRLLLANIAVLLAALSLLLYGIAGYKNNPYALPFILLVLVLAWWQRNSLSKRQKQ